MFFIYYLFIFLLSFSVLFYLAISIYCSFCSFCLSHLIYCQLLSWFSVFCFIQHCIIFSVCARCSVITFPLNLSVVLFIILSFFLSSFSFCSIVNTVPLWCVLLFVLSFLLLFLFLLFYYIIFLFSFVWSTYLS